MVSEKQLDSLHQRYYALADIITSCKKIQELMDPVHRQIDELRNDCKRIKVAELLKARNEWYKAEQNVQFMSFIAGGISDTCDCIQTEVVAVGRVIEDEIDRLKIKLEELQKQQSENLEDYE